MKFLLVILLAVILVIPSSAFAGTWTIRIDQIRPIINYMNRLHSQKRQNRVKSHIVKAAVTPPKAGDRTPAVKKSGKAVKHLKFKLTRASKKSVTSPAEPARIHGSTSGLPVLTVDFVNKPLWGVLQNISSKTGYMFTTKGVNLGIKINLKGRYNLALLLANLFAKDNTTLNLKTKKVEVK